MPLNVESATFDPDTFCWHLPIHLAYGATGSLGIIADVYLTARVADKIEHFLSMEAWKGAYLPVETVLIHRG
jgi:hypothetical protein